VLYFQVNGNLASPIHVLANAEVVEIITYDVSIPLLDCIRASSISVIDF
jgi:hypothetical protein